MSFCHYLGLLDHGQQFEKLTAVGGEHGEIKKMKAIAVISQHMSKEGLTERLMAGAAGRKVLIGKQNP